MKSESILSVCMITYNHEKFIKQAIDGVLKQKCNFNYQLIIGEDCSTDKTRQICEEYALSNSKVKLLPTNENIGMIPNFIRTLKASKGKYIALCEGDDYWTDPYKLQKQVDFLETHKNYSGCVHQTKVIYEDNSRIPHLFSGFKNSIIRINDILEGRIFHTASLVFRAEIIRNMEFPEIVAGDRALNFLVALKGDIYYLNNCMCVYRKNENGISSWVTTEMLKKDFNMIPWLSQIDSSFPANRYRSFIYRTLFSYPQKVNPIAVIHYYLFYVFYSFSYFPNNLRSILYTTFMVLPMRLFKRN